MLLLYPPVTWKILSIFVNVLVATNLFTPIASPKALFVYAPKPYAAPFLSNNKLWLYPADI